MQSLSLLTACCFAKFETTIICHVLLVHLFTLDSMARYVLSSLNINSGGKNLKCSMNMLLNLVDIVMLGPALWLKLLQVQYVACYWQTSCQAHGIHYFLHDSKSHVFQCMSHNNWCCVVYRASKHRVYSFSTASITYYTGDQSAPFHSIYKKREKRALLFSLKL